MSSALLRDRTGDCYLIDHGSGRQTLAVVLAHDPQHMYSGYGWLTLKLSVGERESSDPQELVTEDVDRLERWDRLDEQGSGNVRRLR